MDEVRPDELGDVVGEFRVCLAEPSAVGNSVGDILELVRGDLVEVVEDGVLQDLTVESRYAVDAVEVATQRLAMRMAPLEMMAMSSTRLASWVTSQTKAR